MTQWFAVLLLAAGGATAAPSLVATELPRDTGRHLGDVVEVHALLRWPDGWELEAGALPTGARDGQALELVGHRESAAHDPRCAAPCRRLTLRWQVFKAVRMTEDVPLPALTLQFRRRAELQTVTLPGARLAVSPLVPWDQRKQWHASVRPGREPLPYDSAGLWAQAGGAASAALLALAGWAWARGWWLPRPQRRPFAAAWRAVRRGRGAAVGEQDWQLWHRAFDLTAGRVVMAADLPAFFEQRPALAGAAADCAALFNASQRRFFVAPAEFEQVDRVVLAAVLGRLAAAELGRRL